MSTFEGKVTRVYENETKAGKRYWTLEFDNDKEKRASIWDPEIMKKIWPDLFSMTIAQVNETLPIDLKCKATKKGDFVNIDDVTGEIPVKQKPVTRKKAEGDLFAKSRPAPTYGKTRDQIEERKTIVSARQTSVNAAAEIIKNMVAPGTIKKKEDIKIVMNELIKEFEDTILRDQDE